MSRKRSLAPSLPLAADVLVAAWLTRLPVSGLPGPAATIAGIEPIQLPAVRARRQSEEAPNNSDLDKTTLYRSFPGPLRNLCEITPSRSAFRKVCRMLTIASDPARNPASAGP